MVFDQMGSARVSCWNCGLYSVTLEARNVLNHLVFVKVIRKVSLKRHITVNMVVLYC